MQYFKVIIYAQFLIKQIQWLPCSYRPEEQHAFILSLM